MISIHQIKVAIPDRKRNGEDRSEGRGRRSRWRGASKWVRRWSSSGGSNETDMEAHDDETIERQRWK